MPLLNTTLHTDMLRVGLGRRSLANRVKKAVATLFGRGDYYGSEWGDPEQVRPLRYVLEHFLKPNVSRDSTVLEIGPGGGRWTRYLLPARTLYLVDYHQELIEQHRKLFGHNKNIIYIKNNGSDFPDLPESSVDFIFSFGVFVHLENNTIDEYLKSMKKILKKDGLVFLQYSDKRKPLAASNAGFGDNDPDRMRGLVTANGYEIVEEDEWTLWHSAIICFRKTQAV